EEGELDPLHDGPLEGDVGVAPGAELRVEPEVLVAHVEPAHVPAHAVDDDDLAVVAEVEAEPAAPRAPPAEPGDAHAGLVQLLEVPLREVVAADLVVEEVDADARAGLLDQPPLELPAQAVVADDVELGEDVALGRLDPREDGVEGGPAVDEEAEVVAARERERGELLERPELDAPAVVGPPLGVGDVVGQEAAAGVLQAHLDRPVEVAERPDVFAELDAPEDPVERERDEGDGEEGEDP